MLKRRCFSEPTIFKINCWETSKDLAGGPNWWFYWLINFPLFLTRLLSDCQELVNQFQPIWQEWWIQSTVEVTFLSFDLQLLLLVMLRSVMDTIQRTQSNCQLSLCYLSLFALFQLRSLCVYGATLPDFEPTPLMSVVLPSLLMCYVCLSIYLSYCMSASPYHHYPTVTVVKLRLFQGLNMNLLTSSCFSSHKSWAELGMCKKWATFPSHACISGW